MNERADANRGYSYLLSFPFWIAVDQRDTLPIREIEYRGHSFRVYPPFRSSADNEVPFPAIRAERIPSRSHVPPLTSAEGLLPTALAYRYPPQEEGAENWPVTIIWSEESDDGFPDWYFPTDSLRLDGWPIAGIEDRVTDVIQSLIDQLRLTTKQWWIGRSAASLLSYYRNSIQVTVNGRAAGDPETSAASPRVRGDESAVTPAVWENALDAVEEGRRPPEYKFQILDARYFAAIGDIRRSVLDSAIACEEAIRLTYERLWPDEGPQFRTGRVWEGTGIDDYLSDDLERYVGRSYRDEHPESFRRIEDLWKARGNIAHGGDANFRRDGQVHRVDQDTAWSFQDAVERCITWLNGIER